jgi:hypothetical protein
MPNFQITEVNKIESLDKLKILNHYAKYNDFFYDDRQGLYKVKSEIINILYNNNIFTNVTYLDGKNMFNPFGCDNYITDRYDFIVDCYFEPGTLPEDDSEYPFDDRYNMVYQKIFGVPPKNDILTEEQKIFMKDYALNYLRGLEKMALNNRGLINKNDIAKLILDPNDIFDFDYKVYDWKDVDDDWFELDSEGHSLIEFEYKDDEYQYSFHIPYRSAVEFVDESDINKIIRTAEHYGTIMTDDESEDENLIDILEYFGFEDKWYLFPRAFESKTDHFCDYDNYYDEDDD